MVIGRKAWEVKNSRLVLTVADENISSVGLMIKYKNSNRCKLIKRFIGVDNFSILENLLQRCDFFKERYEKLLKLIDEQKFKIENTSKWWEFPPKDDDVEMSSLISYFKLCEDNIKQFEIKLLYNDEHKIYSACVTYNNEIVLQAIPNGIKNDALNNLKINILICALTLDKLQTSIWELLIDHDNSDFTINKDMNLDYKIVEK